MGPAGKPLKGAGGGGGKHTTSNNSGPPTAGVHHDEDAVQSFVQSFDEEKDVLGKGPATLDVPPVYPASSFGPGPDGTYAYSPSKTDVPPNAVGSAGRAIALTLGETMPGPDQMPIMANPRTWSR